MSTIIGTQGNNTLTGTSSGDLVLALGGNDTINAGAGNDIVGAGAGNDTVDGGSGNDIIDAGAGNDAVAGGSGNDIIDGGAGNDKLSGGSGIDLLLGGAGNDTLDGGAGCDIVSGEAGNDTLVYQVSENVASLDFYDGGSGNDTLRILATAAQAASAGFLSDLAELRQMIAQHGSASTYLEHLGLAVTSIERVEVVIIPGGGNTGPTAGHDSTATAEDTAITISAATLLGNDSDPDAGDTLSIFSVQSASNGTAQLLASGSVLFTPAADFSGTASFTYTVRDAAGASSTATVFVNVAPVADTPTLATTNTTVAEDTSVALQISAALTDASEVLSIQITGVPAGATLSAGTNNGDGTWTLTLAQLNNLSLTPPQHFSGPIQLGVVATSIESNGATAQTSMALTVDVTAVADAPTVSANNAVGNEETAIALQISSALTDASEILSIEISGVPPGATLSAGIDNGDGTWTLTPAQLTSLSLNPAEDFSGTIQLGVTATSAESNGAIAQASTTLTVAVAGVADTPDISAASPTIDALSSDDIIPLGLTLSHGDPSETLTVEIQGVPAYYVLSAGDNLGEGVWSVAREAVETLSLIRVGGDAPVGEHFLTVVVTAHDGTSSAIDTISLSIDVSSPEPERRLVDGYIVGATVFSDTDGDGVRDEGEAFAVTGEGGTFTLVGVADPDAPLVSIGGIDVSTGLAFEGVLTAPGGSTVVTPLTTLVQALIEASIEADPENPIDVADANALVATALGITAPAEGFTNYDPVPGAQSGNAQAIAILSAAIQVQATISQISAAVGGEGGDVASALAQVISDTGMLNLTAETTLAAIVDDVAPAGSSVEALALVTNVVLAANTAIGTAAAGGVDGLAQAANIALGQTTDQLADAELNVAELDVVEQNNTGAALNGAIEAAEIPDAFQVGTLGNDALTGGAGVDVIEGLDGNDQIDGQGGNDALSGGAGNDILTGGAGDDLVDGGAGQDRSVYSAATGAINVQLAAGTVTGDASVGSDTLQSVENIVGTGFADTFNATGFGATSANAGSPTFAGTVNNTFEGGAGDDTITGNGRTTISYRNATAGVTVNVQTGTASGDASVGSDSFSNASFVVGSAFNDTMTGSNNAAVSDFFTGLAGDDMLNGGTAGFDFASYAFETVTGGVTINMAAGTVSGDASTGTDTLRSIESVRGSNFADSYTATGFGGVGALNIGNNQNFNEFEGMGGNDTVVGNGNTRISFTNASGGVTVDLAAGTVSGNSSVGNDTVSGISQVRGSNFDDTIRGSASSDFFDGRAGNDLLDGRGGFDQAGYNNDALVTAGISVDMASGTVTGNATVGTDTLRSIEMVTGTNLDDSYDATGYGGAGALNLGEFGSFNIFQGAGGNDSITGNGNTRISYINSTSGVTVNLATGTATGAAIGADTIIGGVNSVDGSNNSDSITGGYLNETLLGNGGVDTINGGGGSDTITGGAGNDIIDGGTGGDIAVYSGLRSAYTINITGPNQVQVIHNAGGNDGTDALTNVEVLQFGSGTGTEYYLVGSGAFADPVDISGLFLAGTGGLTSLTGATDDFVTIGQSLSGRLIDLGEGTGDTVNLAAGNYTLTIAGVEQVRETSGDQFVTLMNQANGLSFDLGGGNDVLWLASGTNTLSAIGVEQINGTDFGAIVADDTLTLQNNVTGVTVNLGNGTGNILNLAGGTNALANAFGVQTINGTGADDALTLSNGAFQVSVNLGGGAGDTLNVGSFANQLTVSGVETLNLSNGANTLTASGLQAINSTSAGADDQVQLLSSLSGTSVDLGGGADTLVLANGSNSVSVTNVEQVQGSDFGPGNDSDDTLTLQNNVTGVSVNLGNGTNTLNLTSGPNLLNDINFSGTINGSSGNDNLHIYGNLYNNNGSITINLGDGGDALTIGAQNISIGAIGVEQISLAVGTGVLDNHFTIENNVDGMMVALGGGTDTLVLASGANTVRVFDIENLHSADWNVASPATDDTLTLTNTVSGINVNLFQGTNTLNLAAGTNVLGELHGVATVNGTGSDDELTMAGPVFNPGGPITVDLGGGAGDVLNLANNGANVIAVNAETVNGTVMADTIALSTGTTVTGGGGGDFMTASAGADAFRYTAAAQSAAGAGHDQITGFDASEDVFTFSGMGEFAGPINFVGTGPFTGGSQARLSNSTLQIDVDGDTTADMEIELVNPTGGALTNDNFIVEGAVNQPPSAVSLVNTVTSLAENASTASSTRVADIVITDDAFGINGLSLTGADAALFEIVGSELRLRADAVLDFETNPVLDVTVVLDDASAGGSPDATIPFALTITDANEAPTDITLSNASVDENSAVGFVVGTLSAADVDLPDTATYSLLNDAGGRFAISGSNLMVAGGLDYEAATSHEVVVLVTDTGGLTYSETFTITVNNLAEGEILGDGGDNTLGGTSGDDTIRGLGGNDTLTGLDGNDLLDGGAGNDSLNGGAGNDTLDGGAGQDTSIYSAAAGGINVQLAPGTVTGDGYTDTLRSIEGIVGTSFADTFNAAGFGATSINAGSPTFAGTVNNTFEGGAGDDTITGNGRTSISYRSATGGVTVTVGEGATLGSATGDASVGTDTFSAASFVVGSAHNDTMTGSNSTSQSDFFTGLAGNDFLDGRGGFDFASYAFETVTGGVTINMTAGTVTGDASTGTDTLRSIESVRGSNFADSYNATGFGSGANVGNNGTFNEFEGMGGNDTVVGNGNTRLQFTNASGGVSVDLAQASNNVVGNSSVGTDTVSGISQVRGSNFDDSISGTSNNDFFDGRAGNDMLDGRGGFDQAVYNSDTLVTAGISIDMAAGTVTGDATIGTDTLRSIEQVIGTNFADTYVATGFSSLSTNAGSIGTFNSFQGGGGTDTITGNGNTQIAYGNATGAVSVNLALGTATGNASVGTDTITLGTVNSVFGSNFGDTLIGGSGNETFTGGGGNAANGNDTIDGGAGTDMAVFSGSFGQYTTVTASTVTDGAASRDGTDTLSNIEVLQFSGGGPAYYLVATGSSGSAIDVSSFGLSGNVGLSSLTGLDDYLTIGQNFFGRPINLGAGANDTVNLGFANSGYTLGLVGVEFLNGAGGNENVTLTNAATGLSVDLGLGSDVLNLATGANSLSLAGVEQINASGSNNTLTLLNGVSGLTVNLASGTNTLNLNATTNSLTNAFGVQTINGTGSDDTLTLENGLSSATINLGAGTGDTLNVGGFPNQLTLSGVETLNLSNGTSNLSAVGVQTITAVGANDFVQMSSVLSGTSVDLGGGADTLVLANGSNSVSITNVEQIQTSDFGPGNDSDDTLTLQNNVTGVSVNLGNGTNTLNLTSGPNLFNDINFSGTINGSSGNDNLHIYGNLYNNNGSITINLGDGGDALSVGAQNISIRAIGVEQISVAFGTGVLDNHFTIENNVDGMAVYLGDGTDTLVLAGGANTVRVFGIENLHSADWNLASPATDDTLTLTDTVSGVNVNLFQGTNTLNLSAGTNMLGELQNVATVNGSGSDDELTMAGPVFNPGGSITVDLGGGTGDVLNLANNGANVIAVNAETVNGTAMADTIELSTGTTVTGGEGGDFMTASIDSDTFRFTSVSESTIGVGHDQIVGFDASEDVFEFDGIGGFAGQIQFLESGGFTSGGGSEALLVGSVLQIDVDDDGQMTGSDMEIELINLQGTLSSSNFSVIL